MQDSERRSNFVGNPPQSKLLDYIEITLRLQNHNHSRSLEMATIDDGYLDLCCEQLESRLMLAGTVRVRVTLGGELQIFGDAANNHFEMEKSSFGIRIETHFSTALVANGFVNNGTKVDIPVPLVKRVRIVTRGGNDSVALHNAGMMLELPDTRVFLGGGNDVFDTQPVIFDGDLTVIGGGGSDVVELSNSDVHGNLRFVTEDVHIHGTGVTNAEAKVTIVTGVRDNVVNIKNSSINSKTSIWTGGGVDQITFENAFFNSDLRVAAGGGDDRVEFDDGVFFTPVTAILGGGSDFVGYKNATGFSSQFTVYGGPGTDRYQSIFGIGDAPSFAVTPRYISIDPSFPIP